MDSTKRNLSAIANSGTAGDEQTVMSLTVYTALVADNIDQSVIEALLKAMENAKVDPWANSHARGIHRAYLEYGVDGIKMNTLYLLGNLGKWRGEEARIAKKILRRWTTK
jgi:hypothetical protein